MFAKTRMVLFILVEIASCHFAVAASISDLSKQDVRPSMEKMLEYHVEFKNISPVLVKRSFKVFIEQFDAYKIYLLRDEATPFLNMSENGLRETIDGYYQDRFPQYEALNRTIQNAILRARQIRSQLIEELVSKQVREDRVSDEVSTGYARDLPELKGKIRSQLAYILSMERMQDPFIEWTSDNQKKILLLWEKRFQRMENSYLNQEDQNLPLHILKAMAKSLDSHSSFFSPQEAFELRASLEKQFEGVGIVLREGIQGIVIKSLVPGGPAEKSQKIQAGDVLVEINGARVEDLSYEDVLEKLKGPRGKKITLGVKNEDSKIERVELVRDKIVMQDERVQYSYTPCGEGIIGKLDLSSFYESGDGASCEKDLREAIKNLKKQGNLQGLIIDLRENSGGFLTQAVKVAGLFVSSGVIVISKYSQGEMQYLRDVDGRVLYDGPLVLLTSKASASAAEIVAQALQDYGIALVVGDERTYGKGSIQYQTVTDEDAAAYFKVTVGKYYTVSGRSTQIEGVKADIQVPTEYAPYNIGEKYLLYPLKNDQVAPAYMDPLLDVDQKSRAWLQKNYLPYLQKKLSTWTQMLSILKANSDYRLQHDKNFLAFLKLIHQQPSSQSALESPLLPMQSFGSEDLQMNEAIHIVKDMILLYSYQKNPATAQK